MSKFTIITVKQGKCPMCLGAKNTDQQLFHVQGPLSGGFCPAHLMAIVQQHNGQGLDEEDLNDHSVGK